MRALKGRFTDCAVIDKDWDPPIIRTMHGDFEVDLVNDDDDDELLELVRTFLAKKAREIGDMQKKLSKFVKMGGGQHFLSITIPIHTEDSYQDWHSTVGLEIFSDAISLQRWTGTTGERMTADYIGELELLENRTTAKKEH